MRGLEVARKFLCIGQLVLLLHSRNTMYEGAEPAKMLLEFEDIAELRATEKE